jgi:hypothetical protein
MNMSDFRSDYLIDELGKTEIDELIERCGLEWQLDNFGRACRRAVLEGIVRAQLKGEQSKGGYVTIEAAIVKRCFGDAETEINVMCNIDIQV